MLDKHPARCMRFTTRKRIDLVPPTFTGLSLFNELTTYSTLVLYSFTNLQAWALIKSIKSECRLSPALLGLSSPPTRLSRTHKINCLFLFSREASKTIHRSMILNVFFLPTFETGEDFCWFFSQDASNTGWKIRNQELWQGCEGRSSVLGCLSGDLTFANARVLLVEAGIFILA